MPSPMRNGPKSNRNIVERDKSIPLAHKYTTAHFTGWVQALQQQKWRGQTNLMLSNIIAGFLQMIMVFFIISLQYYCMSYVFSSCIIMEITSHSDLQDKFQHLQRK